MRKPLKKFTDAHYAKSGMYKRVLEDIDRTKVCPLCPRKDVKNAWMSARPFAWHTNPILKRENNWLITKSFQPYKNTRYHFLMIGKIHKEHIQSLRAQDWQDIAKLLVWATKRYNLAGGGIALRFGNTAHTGATVSHLHLHLIVPKMRQRRAIPVWFPFG